MINNGIKYSHGLQAQGNRGAFLCELKTKKSLTAGPISLSQGFTLFGITSCLLHEYAFCPYQVETKRQYRGVAVVWYFSPQWLWNFEFLICDISWSAFVAWPSVLTGSWLQAARPWQQMSVFFLFIWNRECRYRTLMLSGFTCVFSEVPPHSYTTQKLPFKYKSSRTLFLCNKIPLTYDRHLGPNHKGCRWIILHPGMVMVNCVSTFIRGKKVSTYIWLITLCLVIGSHRACECWMYTNPPLLSVST